MKKIISLALSLVLVSSAFAGSCLSAQETADGDAAQKIGLICSDPGFESGRLTVGAPETDIGMGAWGEEKKTEFGGGLSITDEDAANGKYSLKVKTPSWKSEFALGLNVEKNTVYTLSFKIKTVGANGGKWDSEASMRIREASISPDNELKYGNYITNNQVINDTRRTGWQQRYFTFKSGDTDLVHMYFGSCNDGQLQEKSTMYLDDISLEEITDNGIIEPLANGSGFEEPLETFMPVMSGSGTMPSWTEEQCTEYKGGVSQSAENPHSGNYSCKILAPDGGGNSGIAAFNVCANTDYVFNFWARCDKAGVNSNASVTVNELVGIGWATTTYSKTPLMSSTVFGDKLSNEWKHFTYVFHSKNAATVHLVIDGLDAAEPIYLDDITLQKSCLKNGAFETDATGWSGSGNAETEWDKWSRTSGFGSLKPMTHYQYQEVRTEFSVKPYTNYKVSFNYQGTPNWLTVKIKYKNNNNKEVSLHEDQVATLCNIENQEKWHAWTNGSLIFNSLNNSSLLLTFMSPVVVNGGPNDCGRLDDIYIVEQLDNTITVDDASKLLFSVDKTSVASGDTVTVRLKAPLSDFVFEEGVNKELFVVPDKDTDVVNNDDLRNVESESIIVPLNANDMEYTFTMKGYSTLAGVSAKYRYNLVEDGKVDILDLVRLKKESSKENPQFGATDLAKLRIYLLSN